MMQDKNVVRTLTVLIFAAAVILIVVLNAAAQSAFVQQAKLLANDGASQDSHGYSVAISGDTAIVGAPRNGAVGFQSRGAAYIYVRNNGVWTQQQKLTPSDGMTTDQFGYSVAINGNTAAVGRYNSTTGQNRADGRVYIFTRTGTTWSETQVLMSSDLAQGDLFGNSLAFESDTLVVGALNKNNDANFFQGAAYVFTRSGGAGNFVQQAKLTADDGGFADFFGYSVAISGDSVIVGAVGLNGGGAGSGRGWAYVFTRSGSNWTQQQKLLAADGLAGDAFGFSVGISGDTAVIGARLDVVGAAGEVGSAYVFTRAGTEWSEQQKLTAAEATPRNDTFGGSVAIKDDLIAIGSPAHEFVGTIANHGAVYIFSRSGGSFSRIAKLLHDDPSSDALGTSVALDGTSVISGAPSKNSSRGASYIFNSVSTQGQAKLNSTDLFTNPSFGQALAISGDTAVIGSNLGAYIYNRSGSNWSFSQKIAATVNGTTTIASGTAIDISGDTMVIGGAGFRINGAFGQGAALIYVREGALWVLQQQLTASDGAGSDAFGSSAAINGDTVIIGARGDGIGANGSQGSAYVFTRSGTVWNEGQKLTASDGALNDAFGSAMKMSGDTVVINAAAHNEGRGAAYVFKRTGSAWAEEQKLTAPDAGVNDQFGAGLAIENDTIVIGAPNRQNLQGAVYVFSRSGNKWSFVQTIFDQDGNILDFFGTDIALAGNALYIGAAGADSLSTQDTGSTYVYARISGTWQKRGEVFAYDAAQGDQFGGKVAIAGNYLAVTAMGDDLYGVSDVGSGYVFDVTTFTFGASGSANFDYDGDGKTDISVFRPSTGDWYLQRSTDGFFGINFGVSSDRIVPADYDGDGKTDVAVYRPSTGVWYVTNSSNGTISYHVFGLAEDIPAPADYDGDGKADISVFRPSTGTWYLQNSSDNSFAAVQFGTNGDKPTVGDFDGDGKSDIAVFRPSSGVWYQLNSSDGTFVGEQFGIAADRVVPADYDGDGKTDIAIYRPSEGLWYVKNSADATYTPYVFGLAIDIPTAGDFDGDGKADIAVFRPSDGTWYIANSSMGGYTFYQFGTSGDVPTPSSFGLN